MVGIDGNLRPLTPDPKLPEKLAASAACEARKQESDRAAKLAKVCEQLGSRYSPACVSLGNFTVSHPGQQQVLDRIRALAERLPEAIKSGENLILYGPSGTGKDHLVASLLHLVTSKHGLTAQYVSGLNLFDVFRLRALGDGKCDERLIVKAMEEADVLAVSDPLAPGKEMTDFTLNELFRLVDNRYRNRRSTWITMNCKDEAEAAARFGVRVWDRIKDTGLVLPCLWPSHRRSIKW